MITHELVLACFTVCVGSIVMACTCLVLSVSLIGLWICAFRLGV
jgi:hypothetical protein